MPTKLQYLGSHCVPAHADRKIVMKYLDELTRVAQIAVGDLYRIWDVISLSYLFSMAVGLSYLLLMRITKIAKHLVLGSVYALIFLSALLIYLFYATGLRSLSLTCGSYGPVQPDYCDKSSYYFYLVLDISFAVISGLYLLKVLKKYPSFEIGISMIKLTSKPLRVMKELALFPIIQITVGSGFLMSLLVLIGWSLSSVTSTKVFSSYIPGGEAIVLEYTALQLYILTFNALMSIWWCNFIVDLGKYVMSGGVSTWYFSRQKSVLYVIPM